MDEARRRTLRALSPLSADDLKAQPTPILSPLVWDLAHIGHQEELWLLRTFTARADRAPVRRHLQRLRARAAGASGAGPARAGRRLRLRRPCARARPPPPAGRALPRGGAAAARRVRLPHGDPARAPAQRDDAPGLPGARRPRPPLRRAVAAGAGRGRKTTISLDAGEFTMGTDEVGWAYDNEQRAHVRHVDAYAIDSHPVTNADYVRFVEAGGYADPGLWSDAGRRWLADEGETHPMYWRRCAANGRACASGASSRCLSRSRSSTSRSTRPRRTRAGPARGFRPRRSGSGRSRISRMSGRCGSGRRSSFEPYPGFKAFPYEGYSAAFFGTGLYRVLRGGSWATHGKVGRHTFRNWDFPCAARSSRGYGWRMTC